MFLALLTHLVILSLNHTMLYSTHCIGQNTEVYGSAVYLLWSHTAPFFLVHEEDKLTYWLELHTFKNNNNKNECSKYQNTICATLKKTRRVNEHNYIETSSTHSGDYENSWLLWCDTCSLVDRYLLLLPSPSESIPWRWKQQIPLPQW
jgi:hypothetical protein